MAKTSKFFLLLLLLGNILGFQNGLNKDKRQAIEIRIGSKVKYDKDRNYFQFKYEGLYESKIFLDFDYSVNINLTNPKGEQVKLIYDDYFRAGYIAGNLKENGTYFLEVFCKSFTCELG